MTKKNDTLAAFNLLFVLLSIALFFAVLQIAPYGDDIPYETSPTYYGAFPNLMPSFGHWRPLDRIYGALIYNIAEVYPLLNHIIVISAHIVSASVLIAIARRFKVSRIISVLSGIMFLLHANAFATFSSIDSINQSLSLAFGALACISYLDRKRLLYVFLAFMSVCAKESGFLFFMIPPALKICEEGENSDIFSRKFILFSFREIMPGVLLTLAYLFFTFGLSYISSMRADLSENIILKGEFYNPLFGSLALLGRISSIDLPALLLEGNKNMPLFLSTFAMGLPLLLAIFIFCIIRVYKSLYVFFICGIIIAFALSHAIVGAITEMNSYPVIFFSMLLAASACDYFSNRFGIKKVLFLIIFPFLIANSIILVHKFSLIYQTNKIARTVIENIESGYANRQKPKNVFVMLIDNAHFGHDIYQLYPSIASGYTEIMKHVWKRWDMNFHYASCRLNVPQEELVIPKDSEVINLPKENPEAAIEKIADEKIKLFDSVWILRQNGEVKIKER